MSKRVQVLGIDIDNHTVRENMFLLEEYVNSDGLNFVCVVTPDLLVEAYENVDVSELLEQMDMCLIGDVAILEVLEEPYGQQAGEIQSRELEENFLSALIRKRKSVYWLSDDESDLEHLKVYMEQHYPKLNIAGIYTGSMDEDKIDALVNDINSVAPDVILLQTAYTSRLQTMWQVKNQLNAKLCVGLSYRIRSKYFSPNRNSKIKSLIDQTMFKRKAIRYQMNQKE